MYEIGKDYVVWMESRKRGESLQNNLRASTFGHPCERFHYYTLTEYRKPIPAELQAIFDEGLLHEKDVEEKLRAIGYEVEGRQKEFRFEKPLITAHIDGFLRKGDGEWLPYDAKSVNPWDFDGLDSAEDFIHSKKVHQRNYPAQILLYMLVTGKPNGCLVLKNKQTGWIKDVWFDFDQHVVILDEAIKRAERVYVAVSVKKPGPHVDDRSLCAKCDFRETCLPDLLANGGVEFLASDDLAQKLARRASLENAADEFDTLDKEVKTTVKETGVGEKACGDFLLTVKEREVKQKVPITWDEKVRIDRIVTITPIKAPEAKEKAA